MEEIVNVPYHLIDRSLKRNYTGRDRYFGVLGFKRLKNESERRVDIWS